MRKIFLIILTIFLWLFGYAQYPITQNLGAPQTMVLNKGGFKTDSALVIPSYSDTTRANQSLGKVYPGNIIRVGNQIYIRNSTATAWVLVGTGGGGGGGSFDTVYAKYPIRVDTTGVKDTLYLAQPFLDSVYNNSPGFLDGLVETGGINLADTSAIVVAPIIWKRNGVVITQNTNALFPIPRADTLNFRTDIIYINSSDSLVYLQGIEDTVNAVAPNTPSGGILITYINVYGSSRAVNSSVSAYQRTGVIFVDPSSGQFNADSTQFSWNNTNKALVIGTPVSSSNPSAILQLTSNNKGFLMPTMSAALRNVISSPANGLMVYDTDSSALFYYDNTQWKKLINSFNVPTLQQVTTAGDTTSNEMKFRADGYTGRYTKVSINPNDIFSLRLRNDKNGVTDSTMVDAGEIKSYYYDGLGGLNTTNFQLYNNNTVGVSQSNVKMPVTELGVLPSLPYRVLALSVNNNFADSAGNISFTSSPTTLQQAFEADSTSIPTIAVRQNDFRIIGQSNDFYGGLIINSGGTPQTYLINTTNGTSGLHSMDSDGNQTLNSGKISDSTLHKQEIRSDKITFRSAYGLLSDSTKTRVGIGTDFPDTVLHVFGSPKFETDSAQAGYVWTSQDATGQGEWRVATAGGADSSVFFTNFRADTMRASLYANKVPYTGATGDVDLGTFKMNAQSFHVKGTAGNGHIGFKHQSAAATAGGQETSLFADNSGDMAWQNANQYLTTLKSSGNTANRIYTYPDSSGTLALLSNVNAKQDTSTSWKTGGNFNVDAGQFIGSINNASLRFRTNNIESLRLDSIGRTLMFRDETGTTGTLFGVLGENNIKPTSNSSVEYRSMYFQNQVLAPGINFTNTMQGGYFENRILNAGTISYVAGLTSIGTRIGSAGATLTGVTQSDGIICFPVSDVSSSTTATINTARGIRISKSLKNSNLTITNQVGLQVDQDFDNGVNNTNILLGTNAAPTGNYSIYSASTTPSYFAGNIGLGITSPASTAALDITSTNRGLLIPRMSTSTRNTISTPAQGLMVWNTTDTTLNQFTGNTWRGMVSTNPSGTINYTAPTITTTTATPIMDLSQTWNNASLINTGFRMNITNTSSSSSSLLMDVQLNGNTTFNISRGGSVFSTNGFRNLNNTTGFINVTTSANDDNVFFFNATLNPTSLNKRIYTAINNFQPASGSATYSAFYSAPTVNQTGGANGIVRGLHVSPTLTSAADFRGIDIENGSIVLPYTGQSATYAIKTSDYLVNCTSGTFTATLPTAVGCTGKTYVLKNSGTGTVTIATTSSQTIDGAATYSLDVQYESITVVSNGSNWIIISNL